MPYTDPQLAEMTAQAKAGVPLATLEIPPAPVRKRRKNEESEMQRKLIRWWGMACQQFNVPQESLYSIPNGSNWSAKRASIMKAEGQRNGIPDLFLAWPGKQWPGIYIEMKTPIGRVSEDQKRMHPILRAGGFRVEICRSFDQGVETITEYLSR